MSIHTQMILAIDNCNIGPDVTWYDSSHATYRSLVTGTRTKLSVEFSHHDTTAAKVTTMVLAPDDYTPFPAELVKVKVVALGFEHFSFSDQIPAKIVIPYRSSDLNGYGESNVAVVCQDISVRDEWHPFPCLIDTVKRQVVVDTELRRFNILQVYVTSDTTHTVGSVPGVTDRGITMKFHSRQRCIAVSIFSPTARRAEMRLYDILGKCVRKNDFAIGSAGASYRWDLSSCANGKYMISITAGNYHLQKSVLLLTTD